MELSYYEDFCRVFYRTNGCPVHLIQKERVVFSCPENDFPFVRTHLKDLLAPKETFVYLSSQSDLYYGLVRNQREPFHIVIGPYMLHACSETRILEIIKEYHLPADDAEDLGEYFQLTEKHIFSHFMDLLSYVNFTINGTLLWADQYYDTRPDALRSAVNRDIAASRMDAKENEIAHTTFQQEKFIYDKIDENGMYLDGPGVREYSQHCQVFAILSGTVTPEKGRVYLQKTLDEPDEYAQCSVAMAYYLFRAMEQADIYGQTEKKWDLWRDMIKKNLTTCVEDGVKERSDCHAWGALALYELPSVVLGVRPAAPGYKKVQISPNPGYFSWAKGEIVTPGGMVSVSWTKEENNDVKLTYKVPEGMEAEVRN